jgi:hypothetical protein
MVPDARAATDFRNPKVEETRISKAEEHTDDMDRQCNRDDPKALEDEEELGSDNAICNKIAVSNASEHLRSRQRPKHAFLSNGHTH